MTMDLGMSERVAPLVEKIRDFTRNFVAPLDHEFHELVGTAPGGRFSLSDRQNEILDTVKGEARKRGLWNFWLTDSEEGFGLSTVEYAYIAEELGWVHLASEAMNCSAPDTGNMEVLERYGTDEHKEKWLKPLLAGEIRSAYLMTEPDVASSDATNLEFSACLVGSEMCIRDRSSNRRNGSCLQEAALATFLYAHRSRNVRELPYSQCLARNNS